MTNQLNAQFKRLVRTARRHEETAVNVKATLSPDDLARACAEAMWKEDVASKGLGMEILQIKAGEATLAMTGGPHMVNGHRHAHCGFTFPLADSPPPLRRPSPKLP